MDVQEILGFFSQSFEDGVLSKSEHKALKATINGNKANKRELDWLRSQVFDLARAKTSQYDSVQLIDWLERANKLLLPQTADPFFNKVYFSPGDDCYKAIDEQIRQACHEILICVFTISDDRLADSILYAQRKGTRVKIITDNDKLHDRGSDIQKLASAGIPIRIDHSPEHMHHKFAVFDKKILVTGSYNWTRSAAEKNMENVLVSNDPMAIKAYLKEFGKWWDKLEML